MAIVSLSSTFGIIWPRFLLLELIIHISIGLIVYVTAINLAGAFIVCWLPFFVMALTLAICGPQCDISRYYIALIQWLGYSNSMLNPGKIDRENEKVFSFSSTSFPVAFACLLNSTTTLRNSESLQTPCSTTDEEKWICCSLGSAAGRHFSSPEDYKLLPRVILFYKSLCF
ncbi:5-hydroxytryptamine receptor 2A [Folsomia candida]|uniref:5-hydroxytryptamine receptor 2A n=1 Tax=Folsomia candida TaxID=158441 RepID=A0A226EJC3_FOLCA|nr:5-hydroxytryptamine receptor 2A [Folsomia candida]